mmetsp:Transcript_38954/g.54337  ORF Transcript_38954/g.54337 Transcript_38954/m.54337 type:complete len:244 (+) Transcript_38954:226-957(+)
MHQLHTPRLQRQRQRQKSPSPSRPSRPSRRVPKLRPCLCPARRLCLCSVLRPSSLLYPLAQERVAEVGLEDAAATPAPRAPKTLRQQASEAPKGCRGIRGRGPARASVLSARARHVQSDMRSRNCSCLAPSVCRTRFCTSEPCRASDLEESNPRHRVGAHQEVSGLPPGAAFLVQLLQLLFEPLQPLSGLWPLLPHASDAFPLRLPCVFSPPLLRFFPARLSPSAHASPPPQVSLSISLTPPP